MLIGISASGDLYFRTRHISLDDLVGEVSQSLQSGADGRVFLWVDRRVRYADVKPVLAAISAAGIENVVLLTNNR